MALKSEHLLTLGDCAQLSKVLNGQYLQGHADPRIAVVGRSNVGKSSLINELLQFKLAQVSGEPGKTRKIHFYRWPGARKIIADLPGYGFASAAKTDREKWKVLINGYLKAETHLSGALVLLDARHGPTPSDLEAIDFLSFKNIPVIFVMTKADTLRTQSMRASRKKEAVQALSALSPSDDGSIEGAIFWVSARTGVGIKALSVFLKNLKSEELD